MGSQVFISYSSKDKPVGDAVCAILEQRGYRCWIAPRDILPGREWGEAIIDGLTSCEVFVLVFSANSNDSPQVRREIERAVHHGLLVIPFRIEDVAPHRSMEYFMSVPHWLDAMTPPLEAHLEELAEVVGRLLDDPAAGREYAPPPVPGRIDPRVAAAALGALILLPVAATVLGFDPPWPSGVGYFSAALVAGGAAWAHFGASPGALVSKRWVKAIVAGLALVAIAYLSLASLYVETIPGTAVRVVKGFTCTPDAVLVYGDSCPALGRDALRDAEWEAATLWTGSSVMLVRVGLVAGWLILVAGLALAAARIERIRIFGLRRGSRRT
ncbi:MAG TPA: toll/interleukin-1 receptor domain-containing protein [Croceibacterium sp.]|nr:toll/interleukin-1 receptor domain-containing protein [Croceibacterium sp.]